MKYDKMILCGKYEARYNDSSKGYSFTLDWAGRPVMVKIDCPPSYEKGLACGSKVFAQIEHDRPAFEKLFRAAVIKFLESEQLPIWKTVSEAQFRRAFRLSLIEIFAADCSGVVCACFAAPKEVKAGTETFSVTGFVDDDIENLCVNGIAVKDLPDAAEIEAARAAAAASTSAPADYDDFDYYYKTLKSGTLVERDENDPILWACCDSFLGTRCDFEFVADTADGGLNNADKIYTKVTAREVFFFRRAVKAIKQELAARKPTMEEFLDYELSVNTILMNMDPAAVRIYNSGKLMILFTLPADMYPFKITVIGDAKKFAKTLFEICDPKKHPQSFTEAPLVEDWGFDWPKDVASKGELVQPPRPERIGDDFDSKATFKWRMSIPAGILSKLKFPDIGDLTTEGVCVEDYPSDCYDDDYDYDNYEIIDDYEDLEGLEDMDELDGLDDFGDE